MLEKTILSTPWTARRSNQSILKEINPEYLLEGLMLKLKLQYTGYLMRRADALEKTLMLGKTENKRRGRQKTRQHHRLNGREVTQIPGNGGGRRGLACGSPLGGKESTRHSNRTTLSPPTDGLEFLFLPLIFHNIRVFSNKSALFIRWPKYWSFSLSISSSNKYSGLISFRTDCFHLLAVQGTLKSLFQHHN